MPVTEEDWQELSQDLPDAADPVITKYLQGRDALIAEEKKQRSDANFRKALSPIARKACAVVARIRDEEKRAIWNPSLEEALASTAGTTGACLHPGMMFTHAKGLMERTRLWRIVRRMPKGALLHAHCDAMVQFDYLFDVLLSTPGMHILSPDAHFADGEARRRGVVQFCFRERDHVDDCPSIWTPDYVPGTPLLLTKMADEFPEEGGEGGGGGGRKGFLAWLKTRVTISQTDSVEQHHGVDHIWRKFMNCFLCLGTIIHYEPIWRAFLQRLMADLHDDGVSWAEVRFTWALNYCRAGVEKPEPDHRHMVIAFQEEVAKFKAEHPGFWGARLIWTAIRRLDTRAIVEDMDHCITIKMEFPEAVAGYDLVGQEDLGRPLRDLLPELFWFRKQCAAEGVELPFFFHAGECLGDGDATDSNLFDAVLLGTRRIGHGFSLYKHPLLVDLVRDRRILVESCPISNEVLRLCGSILSHPLPALLARGVPCAVSNDDPAILGQDAAGMTHDFWQALQGWENLGLAGLGSLAENSVRWAAFEDQTADEWSRDIREASLGSGTKAQRLKQWGVEWEKFCLWIVDEYGEQYLDGDEE
ncbi:uncharacterized protein E0L32_000114 [Thyridium curvatum]|uniref:adenosine deaminase n=1 Tax=Thyridium curvatum TaxID=1093900 RepID=A0A507BGW6_9PEZI|nr:uncharacterized protein E0L32_000114 [Thyridium curvatum]TPX15780.1 hypothetical protein E0L32_000114 [Thyridium curvatum]